MKNGYTENITIPMSQGKIYRYAILLRLEKLLPFMIHAIPFKGNKQINNITTHQFPDFNEGVSCEYPFIAAVIISLKH